MTYPYKTVGDNMSGIGGTFGEVPCLECGKPMVKKSRNQKRHQGECLKAYTKRVDDRRFGRAPKPYAQNQSA